MGVGGGQDGRASKRARGGSDAEGANVCVRLCVCARECVRVYVFVCVCVCVLMGVGGGQDGCASKRARGGSDTEGADVFVCARECVRVCVCMCVCAPVCLCVFVWVCAQWYRTSKSLVARATRTCSSIVYVRVCICLYNLCIYMMMSFDSQLRVWQKALSESCTQKP